MPSIPVTLALIPLGLRPLCLLIIEFLWPGLYQLWQKSVSIFTTYDRDSAGRGRREPGHEVGNRTELGCD